MNSGFSTLRRLLDKYSKNENLVSQIHAQSLTLGLFRTHQNFACKLLNIYAQKLNRPTEAHRIFDQIQNPDIVSWTCLISVYLHTQRPFKALSLFSDMIVSKGLNPDGHCVVAALSACGSSKNFVAGKIVHGMALRYDLGNEGPIACNALIDFYSRNGRTDLGKRVFDVMVSKDVASWTSLVNGYIMCGDIVSARKVFDEMPDRNVISWTAMIVGYVRHKNVIRGLQLFREMRNACEGCEEIRPTLITIVAVLSGCADVGALDFGGTIHSYIYKLDSLVNDVSVNNALIDMYSKGGHLEYAQKIFLETRFKDVFSWTSLITGLALHGEGITTVELFNNMIKNKITPNEITFLSVLSACCHGGLIQEGRSLFHKMVNHYQLNPTIKHYGCMVDLFCRAGHLPEALHLIDNMPLKPDAVIWRSILSACLIKKDLELAEIAAKKVIELEPCDDGVYILLLNVYRSMNKWEDVLTTQKLMRSSNIKKQPGCSWIEVNGFFHEFAAEDTMNRVGIDMQIVLEVIKEELRFVNNRFMV